MTFLSLALLLLLNASSIFAVADLKLLCSWNQMDFSFPTPQDRTNAIKSGLFVQPNVIPIDVDVDYHGSVDQSRIFVTTPRSFSVGVPISLGYIAAPQTNCLIKPYPNYSWHSNVRNCDLITSVLRVATDNCHQLWVLDSGVVNNTQMCPPKLLVFNLLTDTLVHRYVFPSSQYTTLSLFITPVLDFDPLSRTCCEVKVYIADVTGYALIVYDFSSDTSWKIVNPSFKSVAPWGHFTVARESFDLMDGLFGLALTPRNCLGQRLLYYHPLASNTEYTVPLNIISNPSLWANPNSQPSAFQAIGSRGVQTAAQAMDSNGNLFFVLMNPLALVCWDSSTTYSPQNIRVVVQNNSTLQFASGLKIIKNLSGVEEIFIMTNRFQKIANGDIDPNECNYRVQVAAIKDLLGGTRCVNRAIG